MIGYLKGIARCGGIIVTGDGVGYVVHCVNTHVDDEPVEVLVTTIVREDAITLFGFADRAEQMFFDALRAVQGVGPQTALNLLRDVGPAGIAAAVLSNNSVALKKAAGVGAASAVKIMATIKLPKIELPDMSDVTSVMTEVAATLELLGFDSEAARGAVREANSAGLVGEQALLSGALTLLRAAA